MSRLLLSSLLMTLNIAMSIASPLSRDDARQRAATFLSVRSGAAARAMQPSAVPVLTDADSPSPLYYAFNVGEEEGFVIVCADDRPEAVIGYSEHGAFDAATMPKNARAWLDELENPENLKTQAPPIRPLLSTQWGQQWPYNEQCPTNSASGCLATAMAQVMNYHRWPRSATTAIPAYSFYDELPPTTFNWDNMLNGYSETAGQEHCEAVAHLMHYCGRALQMKYGPNSSAYESTIPIALTRYFDYDKTARVVFRMDYSIDEWESLLLRELQAGRPVIYSGRRSTVGHEFVVDGYDGRGFYHFNWGWGGQSDGWYRLPAANPLLVGTGGGAGIGLDGFSCFQSAVIGVQPDQGGTASVQSHRLTAEGLWLTSVSSYERSAVGKSFSISVCSPVANHTADTLECSFGLALLDSNGQLVGGSETLSKSYTFGPCTNFYRDRNQDFTFGANLTGTYRIVPVCNFYEGETSELKVDAETDRKYIEAVLTEKKLTLTEHPSRHLEIDDVTFVLMGTTIVATATVSNHGDDYDGLLYLFISGLRVAYTGIGIPAGGTAEAIFCYERRQKEQDYQISYTKDKEQCIAKGTANYTTVNQKNIFTVWYGDGRSEELTIDNDGVATVPPQAVAADFGSCMPVSIVPSVNPNCIYYIDNNIAATEQLRHVVVSHFTPELTLTDGCSFFCPKSFTAGRVTYTRTFASGYDGKGSGWDTIILPFHVQTVTPEGRQPIDWFHSPQDSGKDFWLMTYTAGTDSSLTFSHAQAMTANRPYLIAVPGDEYGERSLQGCRLTFAADYAVVHQTALTADTTDGYSFNGSYAVTVNATVGSTANTEQPVLLLNAKGDCFKGSPRPILPFRAAITSLQYYH